MADADSVKQFFLSSSKQTAFSCKWSGRALNARRKNAIMQTRSQLRLALVSAASSVLLRAERDPSEP